MKMLKVRQPDGSIIGIPLGKGADGKSAYQIALGNGFEGTEAEWLESLAVRIASIEVPVSANPTETDTYKVHFSDGQTLELTVHNGRNGTNGKSVTIESVLQTPDGSVKTLCFSDGTNVDVENGKSAYQIALDNGFDGTEAEWLASLKGEPYELNEEDEQKIVDAVLSNFINGAEVAL